MARFRIEDREGAVGAVMFADAFQRYPDRLTENAVLLFASDVDASREEISVRVHDVHRPEDASRELAGLVQIDLGPDAAPRLVRETCSPAIRGRSRSVSRSGRRRGSRWPCAPTTRSSCSPGRNSWPSSRGSRASSTSGFVPGRPAGARTDGGAAPVAQRRRRVTRKKPRAGVPAPAPSSCTVLL